MLRLDTFIVAEFVSMLNFFYKKMPGSRLATPTFIIEPKYLLTSKKFDEDVISTASVYLPCLMRSFFKSIKQWMIKTYSSLDGYNQYFLLKNVFTTPLQFYYNYSYLLLYVKTIPIIAPMSTSGAILTNIQLIP